MLLMELWYWFFTVRWSASDDLSLNEKLLPRQVLHEWTLKFDYGCNAMIRDDKSDFRSMN